MKKKKNIYFLAVTIFMEEIATRDSEFRDAGAVPSDLNSGYHHRERGNGRARFSRNWRDQDFEDQNYFHRRGRGRGRGNAYGEEQGEMYPQKDGNNAGNFDKSGKPDLPSEGSDSITENRFRDPYPNTYRPFRGGRGGRGSRGGRGFRNRRGGDGYFSQESQEAQESTNPVDTSAQVNENFEKEKQHDNYEASGDGCEGPSVQDDWRRERRGRGGRMNTRFDGRGRGGRGSFPSYNGSYPPTAGERDEGRRGKYSQNKNASSISGELDGKSEAISVETITEPAVSKIPVANAEEMPPADLPPQNTPSRPAQRKQRAPHLRSNCRNEDEILALFDCHHKQKGISLANYSDIPVEMVPGGIRPVEFFSQLDVEPILAENIERCGYKVPTPVQRYGIPVALQGQDLMACAQTGSGKTAAFLIPIVNYILVNGVSPAKKGVSHPIGLVLAPTRELALQIFDEVRKITFRTDIFVDVVYGGTAYPSRFENDILVACPGRLADMFDRGLVSLSETKFLVLDEADRMLEMGFEEQIEHLVCSRYSDMPQCDDRQTLMFSATFPQRILNLAKRYLRKRYYILKVGRVGSTTKNITQMVERVENEEKIHRLFELIYAHKKTDLVLVFVETKKAAEDLHRELNRQNIPSATIHGDRRQQDRESALASFKAGKTPILVATDVASRGLDIPDVSHVIQFDLPSEIDDYTHRIGRTGRAGNKGTATCFYNNNNRKICLDIFTYFTEHDQQIPGWLKEEAERIEGEALLSRSTFSGSRAPKHVVEEDNKGTWGDSCVSRGMRPSQSTQRKNTSDDGGF